MTTIPTAKECALHGVKEQIKYFVAMLSIGFHPDTDFNDYVNIKTGRRIFSKPLAKRCNAQLEECFAMCEKYGLDIYEISLNAVNEIMAIL